MRYAWNDEWLFVKDFEKGFEQAEVVRLPHNVQELSWNYCRERDYQMVCGYEKTFFFEPLWRGKRIFVTFDGAAHYAEVFLNGRKVGEHACGYTAFTVELTGELAEGRNVLSVKLDTRESLNQPPFGHVIDYMTYGGLYREVWLDVREQCMISDVFVTTEQQTVNLALTLDFEKEPEEGAEYQLAVAVRTHINQLSLQPAESGKDQSGKAGDEKDREHKDKTPHSWKRMLVHGLEEGKASRETLQSCSLRFSVPNVRRWDLDTPTLYDIQVRLLRVQEGVSECLDVYRTTFGFRSIEFRRDGFYLNGRLVKLRGLNRHQCFPYVGYAMPASMQRQDAMILKRELGVNAVRTSHYPQSQHFLDACDELGILVFTEMPGWQHVGDASWQEQALDNCREMILQNRNHASIIIWGVRINESLDADELYTRTNALAHELDATRPTTGVRYLEKSHLLEDVYAFNDFSFTGEGDTPLRPKKRITPDQRKPYFVSEFNGHMYPTKMWDGEEHRREHARRHAMVLRELYRQPEVLGCFGWCMFDYNTHKDFGSGDRICYHGVMDMFRNPKPAAAVYASQQEEKPVLEVTSTMDIGEHPGGNVGPVYVYTNADSVRLYKNDTFVREYQPGEGFLSEEELDWREHSEEEAFAGVESMPHPPICMNDFIGGLLESQEGYAPELAAELKEYLLAVRKYGQRRLPVKYCLKLGKLMLVHGIRRHKVMELLGKYVGSWGGLATVYRVDAIKNKQVVDSVFCQPVTEMSLQTTVSHSRLVEEAAYDVASVRIRAVDGKGNQLWFFNEPLRLEVSGELELIGPEVISLKGGAGGCYVRSRKKTEEEILEDEERTGNRTTALDRVLRKFREHAEETRRETKENPSPGRGTLTIRSESLGEKRIAFTVLYR